MARQMYVCTDGGDTAPEKVSKAVINPTNQAVNSVANTYANNQLDISTLFKELQGQIDDVSGKDLTAASQHLAAQAVTLGTVYNELMQRALTSESWKSIETFMKLALKAQSQARCTWETISKIQNPPLAGYVAQQNVGYNQQVNNGHAREIKNAPNELLEAQDDERLDTRATSTTGEVDQELETLGKIDRPND